MLKTAWILAKKDFAIYFRDRTALLLSLALPICLATLFGAAMGGMFGSDEGVGKIKLFVEDLDQTDRSKALVVELQKSAGLDVRIATGVRRRVADGKGPTGLLVPSGYSADLDTGTLPKLVLYRDPAQIVEQQIVAGSLIPALFKASGRDIGRVIMKQSLAKFGLPAQSLPEAEHFFDSTWESIASVAAKGDTPAAKGGPESFDFARIVPDLLGVEVEDVAGEKDSSAKTGGQAHSVAGIAVMMLLFGIAACGGTILEEEVQGTMQRLRLTPASGRAILAGKYLFTVLLGLMQLTILFVYGALVFQVPIFRSPVALIVLSIAVASAATGLGLLLAVVCRSRKQLEGLSTLFILAMSALGGSWFPLAFTPTWYRKLGHFTLNAWAMDGYQGIFWYGKGLAGIALEIGVLVAIAVVAGFLTLRAWRKRFEVAM